MIKPHTASVIHLIHEHVLHPTQGCEIGIWKGETSAHLLIEFPTLHLLMVDRYGALSEEETANSIGRKRSQEAFDSAMVLALERTRIYQDRRTMLVGESFEASTYVKDNFLDFVFIDGHHSYESVRFDIQTWFPKVKNKGLICGDDYDSHRVFGVKKAVDEFAKTRGYRVEVTDSQIWWVIK